MRGIDEVHHLAFVNGTATFLQRAPTSAKTSGVKGISMSSMPAASTGSDAWCSPRALRSIVAAVVPTDETAPAGDSDPLNPRLSYGAGKIISEMMVINHGPQAFRAGADLPAHNVYGPDMGFEHVIPQFAVRLKRAIAGHASGAVPLRSKAAAKETRSFWPRGRSGSGRAGHARRGEHLGIYHVGTTEEVTIADLARRIAGIAAARSPLRPRGAARQHAAPVPRHFEVVRARL